MVEVKVLDPFVVFCPFVGIQHHLSVTVRKRESDLKFILESAKDPTNGDLGFDPSGWTFQTLEAHMKKLAHKLRRAS